MTDQRDLAKEVEPFMQLLTEAAVEGVECTISNEMARSLSDFIASQSRELEELRAQNERLQTAFDQAVFENTELESQIAALRRPVVQSDEIAMALYELDAAVHASCIQDGDYSPVKVIRDALDQAQREKDTLGQTNENLANRCATLQEEINCAGITTDKLQAEIARLSSPPEERRDIQERQRDRKATGFGRPHPGSLIADVDTLLEDLRRYENSHAIVMGERDAALAKVERLEQDERESFKRAESFEKAYAGACERIERLEGAARRVVDEWDRDPQCRVDVPAIGKLRLELAAADGQQKYIVQSICPVCRGGAVGLNPLYKEPSATGDGVAGGVSMKLKTYRADEWSGSSRIYDPGEVNAVIAAKDAEISDLKMRLDDARRVSDLWAKRCLDIEAAYTGGSCEHCFRGFTDPGEPCNHCNPPHPDTARLEKLPEIFNKLIFTDGWWWSQVTQQKYNTVREAIDAHQEPNNGPL